MKAKTTKEVLIAAKWILEHHRWRQGKYHMFQDGKHSFCAVGALQAVEASEPAYYKAYIFLSKVTSPQGSIPYWNDQSYQTKRNVIDAFDRAIESAQ